MLASGMLTITQVIEEFELKLRVRPRIVAAASGSNVPVLYFGARLVNVHEIREIRETHEKTETQNRRDAVASLLS